MIGTPCRFDGAFNCFKWEDCLFTDLQTCLKQGIVVACREVELLKHRQMQKHTTASLKWRNQAFYFKRRAKQLELCLQMHQLEVPSTEELERVELETTTSTKKKRKGRKHGQVRNNDKETKLQQGSPLPTM